jgi:cytochrome d ubiquinol oxidase subunit I
MKALSLRRRGERWNDAARFWIRIFGINFAVGVVTGTPMESQFVTNYTGCYAPTAAVVGFTPITGLHMTL